MRIPEIYAQRKCKENDIARDISTLLVDDRDDSIISSSLRISGIAVLDHSSPGRLTNSSMQQVNIVAPCAMQEGELHCAF
jgi:hypothetical protein